MPRETIASVKADAARAAARKQQELDAVRQQLTDALALGRERTERAERIEKFGTGALDGLRELEKRNAVLLGFILAKVPIEEIPTSFIPSEVY